MRSEEEAGRHAAGLGNGMHSNRQDGDMSAIKARSRRAANAPTVLLQGRVSPDARAEVQDAARRSGVSIAYYLDTLIAQLVDENGSLPLVDRPVPQTEELPIPAA